MVAVPLKQLQLLEGQDMALVSKKELLVESIWSTQHGTHRPVDPGHFRSRCTAIGPAGLNRVRVLVARFVPVGWPRPVEWWALFEQEFGIAMPLFLLTCRRAADDLEADRSPGGGVSGGGPCRP